MPLYLTRVTVSKRIYSEAPARTGIWTIMKEMLLAEVPRVGDQIEPADGWGCDTVAGVIFSDGGAVDIRMDSMRTDSQERLDEIATLVAEHGWQDNNGISGPLVSPPGE